MANIKTKRNNYFGFTSCWSLTQYMQENPQHSYSFENIMTGVACASDGTKPLSKRLLFRLLRDLEVIDTPSVKAAHAVADRQAQRICSALRVIANALERAGIPKEEITQRNSFYWPVPSNEIATQHAEQ